MILQITNHFQNKKSLESYFDRISLTPEVQSNKSIFCDNFYGVKTIGIESTSHWDPEKISYSLKKDSWKPREKVSYS